jgi:tetratricopeptide (TPR) repeat protein
MVDALPKTIGSYQVISLLGEGAMGAVYRARLSLMPEQDYAVKLLWERCKPKEVSAFLGECSKVKRLGTHPHLVPLHFAGRDRKLGRYYVAMEYVDGPTAAQFLNEIADRQLPFADALRIALHAALGLEHAHQRGILHLDVKPSNILIQREGKLARLADFGNAQLMEGEDRRPPTDTGQGTPAYMAWEQTFQGQQAGLHPDARTDVYGLAATLYELLTGHLPLPDEQGRQTPPRHWRADLPEALEYLLMQALSRDPEQRPATMYAFRRALEYYLPPDQARATLLPTPAQRLVGREALLRALKQHLLADDSPALCALHGLPGVGKTALALTLANDPEVHQQFPDGVLWAGLGTQPNLPATLNTWAEALGIQSASLAKLPSLQAQMQAVQRVIGQRQVLLVIDDAWDVEAALTLKVGGPRCAHLITTRLPDVALRLVDEGAQVVRVQELGEADGLALLARLAPEAVQFEPEEARALVRAVDGLPLALSLMGNYLRTQGYSGQRRRLRAALDLLRQGKERLRLEPVQAKAGEGAETSRSLIASIGTSYQALDKRARSLLLALSVFPAKPNSFSEEAALAVAGVSPRILDRLIDAGLLESSGPGRYTLHQTIADYARLKHSSKRSVRRMTQFYVEYLNKHKEDYGALDRERENTLTSLQLACEQGLYLLVLRGVGELFEFLTVRGLTRTVATLLERTQQAFKASGDAANTAKALYLLGNVAQQWGDFAGAEQCWQEGLLFARQTGDGESICNMLQVLGGLAEKRGDLIQAEDYLQEGLALATQINHLLNICVLLRRLGGLAQHRGYNAEAEACYREALKLARQMGRQQSISAILTNLGILAGARDDYAQEEAYYQEALHLARQMGYRERIINLLNNLGEPAVNQGNFERARAYYQEGLGLARQIDAREDICFFLTNLGEIASNLKDYQQAEISYQEGLSMARQMQHDELIGILLTDLGTLARERDEDMQAELCLQEGQALASKVNNPLLLAHNLHAWAELYLKQTHPAQALSTFQKLLELAREIESKRFVATALYGMARVAAAVGDYGAARSYGEESLMIFGSIGYYKMSEVATWLASSPLPENQSLHYPGIPAEVSLRPLQN